MPDLFVDWADYQASIERLARLVAESDWDFDQIVCIARGGLRIGDALSRIFKLPLAIISTRSYEEEGGTLRGDLAIASHITMTTASLGTSVLLVDDLADSGATLIATVRHLQQSFPIRELRTAVLWVKGSSQVRPDYHVHFLPDNPWIHQPFEPYEAMDPRRWRRGEAD